MLGKYSTKVVLPKSKSDLARAINNLGHVQIKVLEPIRKSNVKLVTNEIDLMVSGGNKTVSVIIIKN